MRAARHLARRKEKNLSFFTPSVNTALTRQSRGKRKKPQIWWDALIKEGEDSADVRVCQRLISSAAVKSAKLFLEENQLKLALGRGDTDHPPLAV